MAGMKKHNHLTLNERNQIVVFVNRHYSLREIARRLKRNVGSISREIKRNFGRKRYRAHKAHERSVQNHSQTHKRMRLKSRVLQFEIEKLLMQGWSPELIAGRLKMHPSLPATNYESIYQWIYNSAPHLIEMLVRRHPNRWKKGRFTRKHKHKIPQRISIQQRPEIINSRQQPGHWESDLIIGKGSSAIQVSVERKFRFTRLQKILRKTAAMSSNALSKSLSELPQHLRRSITYDNGSENSDHLVLNSILGTSSYFCEPYHSWEKGTVENTNGLIRRFLPKKTNFDTISETQIFQVESWLNNRPRKCLKFFTPAEALNSAVAFTP